MKRECGMDNFLISNQVDVAHNKVGIVILNYLNYYETIRCVNSIRKKLEERYQIVIVENGSPNESYEELTRIFATDENVFIAKSDKNVGFARGNNIGITILRKKYQCDFVLLLNSDTLMIETDYIRRLLTCYGDNVGVIEANVWDRKGLFAQPQYFVPSFSSCLYIYLKALCQYNHIYFPWKYDVSNKEGYLCQVGCAMLLTPQYFKVYSGLYSKTFLYGEEQILLLLLKKANLKLAFCDTTYIIHNEGGSTAYEALEGSRKKEKKVLTGYFNLLKASILPRNKLIKATKGGRE